MSDFSFFRCRINQGGRGFEESFQNSPSRVAVNTELILFRLGSEKGFRGDEVVVPSSDISINSIIQGIGRDTVYSQ